MRMCTLVLMMALMLMGCKAQDTFETVADTPAVQVLAPMQSAIYTLPQEASLAVMGSEETGSVYLCDGYTVTVQTFPGGDLNRTICDTTGFSADDLTLMRTQQEGYDRVECVWSAASEEGEQLGRMKLLDDGSYHYVITCMASAADVPELQPVWQELFDSFRIVSPEAALHTGS